MPQIQHSIEARYHLDEPVWRQFLRYLHDLARGDLGPSFQYRNTSVNELIAQGLPVDLTIGGCARCSWPCWQAVRRDCWRRPDLAAGAIAQR